MVAFRKTLLFVLLLLLPPLAIAQNIDVLETVHLNDGAFYIGVITEMVMNDSLEIITLGGEEMRISLSDVKEITREKGKITDAIKEKLGFGPRVKAKRIPRGFKLRPKGYYLQWQHLVQVAQYGFRVVQGYKFAQFHSLGVGVGIERSGGTTAFFPKRYFDKRFLTIGTHLPLFIHYERDFLNKRTTPFYAAELGYSFRFPNRRSNSELRDFEVNGAKLGGLYASMAFGVRFNTSRRYHTNLALHLNLKSLDLIFRELYQNDDTGLWYLEYNSRSTFSLFFGLTIIQGI